MSKRDYYEVLGVDKNVDKAGLKKAFRRLARQYHPDVNKDPEAEGKFREINEANEILSDPQKRAAFDRYGHAAFENGGGAQQQQSRRSPFGAGGHDMNDIFGSDFFSDFMGGQSRQSKQRSAPTQIRGSDITASLEISLEEAFNGLDKKISFSTEVGCKECSGQGTKNKKDIGSCKPCHGSGAMRVQQGFFVVEQVCDRCEGTGCAVKNPCNICRGQGRYNKQKSLIINVPSGIENDTRMRISGEGEAGLRGGTAGDLYVYIKVKSHETYQVENSNLHFKLPLTITKAALGGEVEIPIIDGSKVKLKIPAGTETGDKIRLREKGMSKIRSSSRGDLYAHAYVQTPKKLTSKQRLLLEELDEELSDIDFSYKDEGFFSRMKSIWS